MVIGSIAYPSLALFLIATGQAKKTSALKSIQCTEVSFMRLVSGSNCLNLHSLICIFLGVIANDGQLEVLPLEGVDQQDNVAH
jgi:hypothetical protein